MTMLSINTNVGALKAAQASYSVNKSMETSMARLSSGKRINSAADDAAGIQIANRLTAEIQGLNMAIRGTQRMLKLCLQRLKELIKKFTQFFSECGNLQFKQLMEQQMVIELALQNRS